MLNQRCTVAVLILSVCLLAAGCKKSSSNSNGKNAAESSSGKSVAFRGKQFSTIVPAGWVVSFPDENTRYQIGKIGDEKNREYEAVIRLDVGKPKEDLATTADAFAKQFNLKKSDGKYDWGGQDSILLVGKPKGILEPQQLLLTQRYGRLFIFSISRNDNVDVQAEVDLLMENWQWDKE